jgi:Ser/Thr protein kinase RdoA (MazF antagonist)
VEFGGLPAKVIKLPGRSAGLLREQRVIRILRQGRWALPLPALEFTQDELPSTWQHDEQRWARPRVVTVMPLYPGITLADAVLRGEPWAGEAMHAAGAFAARLAEVSPAAIGRMRRVQSEAQICGAFCRVEPVIDRFGLGAVHSAMEIVAEAMRRPAHSLAHGQFCPENMVVEPGTGGTRLTVLDWETVRPSSSLADVATLSASLAQLAPGDAGQRAYLRRCAIDGFAALRPLADRDERELRAWEIFFLLLAARDAMESGRIEIAGQIARTATVISL